MTLRLPLLAFFIAGIATVLTAQDDLTRDRAFFEQQSRNYQRWLETAGLAPRISVRAIETEPQRVLLYLQFPTDNVDTVKGLWRQLQSDYAARQTGMTLEEALFFKMLQLMELRQSAAYVLLYDTYDTRREPNFFRAIYADAQGLRLESSGDMSAGSIVTMPPEYLGDLPLPAVFECERRFPRDIVLTQAYDYLRRYFERQRCDSLPLRVSPPQKLGDLWRFEVTNLCTESLRQTPASVVTPFLTEYGKPADWIRHEKLSFTLIYQGLPGGCRLKCLVEVKVGNIPYDQAARGDYLELDGPFLPYVRTYAEGLMKTLRGVVCGD